MRDDDETFYDPADPDAPDDGGPEPAEGATSRDGEGKVHQLPTGGNGGKGTPLADRDAEAEEEDGQQAMFTVVEQGRKVTLGTLVNRGTPVENRYVLTGKSLQNVTGGIIDPYATSVLLVADCVVDSIKPQYVRDGQQRVEKVILYVTLKPRVVQQALSEAGKVMLKEAAEAAAA